MRALVYEAPRVLRIRDIPDPVPRPDEVVIAVAYSGICGSELSGYLGENELRRPPLVFGHEFSGVVEALGAEVPGRFWRGQPVTVNPLIGCQRCRLCLGGQPHLCPQRRLLSASLPGSNAELVAVPADAVYPLPTDMPLELAALTEPAACAVRAVRHADPHPWCVVLVAGMGPLGLLIVQALRAHGVAHIVTVERNLHRRRIAETLGVVAFSSGESLASWIREHADGVGVDIALDAVGSTAVRRLCLESVAPGGRVVFFGLHEPESVLPVNAIVRREITCAGSFAYTPDDFSTALRWLHERRLSLPGRIVTAPLEDGAAWFEHLLAADSDVIKVLLQPRPTARG
jgi:threonine dehydrogenase-like Zn-dependent dehydrogenase